MGSTERSNTKLKILYLLKILMEETDEFHGITLKEIENQLNQYGINAERKGIYRDIGVLIDYGIDIIGEQKDKTYYYRVVSRKYELAELKMLIDAVQSSRFITEKKSKELIEKITSNASKFERSDLQRHIYVNGRLKTDNRTILINVDHIHEAMSRGVKIYFKYFNWTVDKEKELRHDGQTYLVSPWELVLDNENYYLVAFDDLDKKIKHYRVDKMLDVNVSNELRDGKKEFNEINISEYASRVFGMYGGVERQIHLRCKNNMAGIMIDQFGKDVTIIPIDDEHFELITKVAVSTLFLSWIIGLGDDVKIIGPTEVVVQIKEMIDNLARLYSAE